MNEKKYQSKAYPRMVIETICYDIKVEIADVETIEIYFTSNIEDELDVQEQRGALYIRSECEKKKIHTKRHYGSIICRVPNTVQEIECNGVDTKVEVLNDTGLEYMSESINVRVVNGYIDISNITKSHKIKLDAVAGEIHVRNTKCVDLTIQSVSNRIVLDQSPFENGVIHTVEGQCVIYQNKEDEQIDVVKKTLFGSFKNTSDSVRSGASHLTFYGVSGDLQIKNRDTSSHQ